MALKEKNMMLLRLLSTHLSFSARQLAVAATTITQNQQSGDPPLNKTEYRGQFLLVLILIFVVLRVFFGLVSHLRQARQANDNGDIEMGTIKQPEDVEEFIDALPLCIYGKHSTERMKNWECSVCLEKFKEGDSCRVLPTCRHTYHMLCIDEWLFSSISCPLCRNVARFNL